VFIAHSRTDKIEVFAVKSKPRILNQKVTSKSRISGKKKYEKKESADAQHPGNQRIEVKPVCASTPERKDPNA